MILGIAAVFAAAYKTSAAWAETRPILVFAAASLKNALDAINEGWQRDTRRPVTASYAASSTLAKQIENGAPADLFISADPDWMDYLQQRNLIKPESRSDLLGNSLVLIAPVSSTVKLTIAPGFALAAALGGGRLAMADPAAVPAGLYGKAALEKLGVWSSVANRIAAAENVRAALLLVARGEAPLGIVYRTDAAIEPGVRIADTFPSDTHPPIVYPIALTASSDNPNAPSLLVFLRGAAARAQFQKAGFALLNEAR
ncbi:MAG: molybdate ABC transporter substrate-binding protein [Alphaproteobacteria bacterium]|nr:molybdate ABC transporter substrate-binding protein [Alphaproteobacteria bacterium]MBV9017355.1 molybdate ABC transporter substrate-binding protein [Alphaproteobacteria bacterium]